MASQAGGIAGMMPDGGSRSTRVFGGMASLGR